MVEIRSAILLEAQLRRVTIRGEITNVVHLLCDIQIVNQQVETIGAEDILAIRT